ncbi:hypothetical protein MAR_018886 [Mya arenaria]|uniref:Uncharacterized protein n=1 Tax=Mya arenaria TaxID=6604 RepID=A0ABY7EFZ3_MYAAR|nr:uncharacterized protein LOC128236768 [Mya arenaria]WAR08928.1 hypothetical protein MAR_018886 [Mya arenaria]
MNSLLVNDAAEYNAATNRINSALQTLRDEMKSLRHQDVTLMQQFITMNDAIKSISKEQKTEKTRKKRMRNRTLVLNSASITQTTPSWQSPLVRQQSVPRYCDVIPEERTRTWSCSSDELSEECLTEESQSDSMTSSDGDDVSSDEERLTSAFPVFQSTLTPRLRSKSMKTRVSATQDVTSVETILNKNVKLWKGRIDKDENDSVFVESCLEGEENL